MNGSFRYSIDMLTYIGNMNDSDVILIEMVPLEVRNVTTPILNATTMVHMKTTTTPTVYDPNATVNERTLWDLDVCEPPEYETIKVFTYGFPVFCISIIIFVYVFIVIRHVMRRTQTPPSTV